MSFKYVNPGYNEGQIFQSCGVVAHADSKHPAGQSIRVYTTKALYPLAAGCNALYLKAYRQGNTNIEFETANNVRVGIYDYGNIEVNNQQVGKSVTDSDQEVYMKIFSNAENGIFELYVDGLLFYSYTGDVLHGADIANVAFRNGQISSLIISDEEFLKTEKICVLTPKTTTATMTDNGDGSYTATAENQNVLQTFDIDDLTTKVNGGTVTGLVMVGNPAYCVDGDLGNITAMKGTSEKGTKELPTVTDKPVLVSWSENLNPAALDGVQMGWKAKA